MSAAHGKALEEEASHDHPSAKTSWVPSAHGIAQVGAERTFVQIEGDYMRTACTRKA